MIEVSMAGTRKLIGIEEAATFLAWVKSRLDKHPDYPFPNDETVSPKPTGKLVRSFKDLATDTTVINLWADEYMSNKNMGRFWGAWRQKSRLNKLDKKPGRDVKLHMSSEAAEKIKKLAGKKSVSEYILDDL